MIRRHALLALALLAAMGARADRFAAARYQRTADQLIVTMVYRGTNPDHEFTLRWGECNTERGEATVAAEVLDSQSRDAARQDFRKTAQFDLRDMPCRPARAVLHTAPRYYIDVQIPAAP